MKRYRKKPVVVEAQPFYPEQQPYPPGVKFGKPPHSTGPQCHYIETLEGWHEVSPGDYIIRGVEGELYPCKPSIFEATYEQVGGEEAS